MEQHAIYVEGNITHLKTNPLTKFYFVFYYYYWFFDGTQHIQNHSRGWVIPTAASNWKRNYMLVRITQPLFFFQLWNEEEEWRKFLKKRIDMIYLSFILVNGLKRVAIIYKDTIILLLCQQKLYYLLLQPKTPYINTCEFTSKVSHLPKNSNTLCST